MQPSEVLTLVAEVSVALAYGLGVSILSFAGLHLGRSSSS